MGSRQGLAGRDARHTGRTPAEAMMRPLPPGAVTLLPGFWSRRKQLTGQVSLAHAYAELRRAGNISYFEAVCAGDPKVLHVAPFEDESHDGSLFDLHRIFDSDVYKWLEAAAHHPPESLDEPLRGAVDAVITLVERAQMPDGYLNTWVQLHCPDRRWVDWHLAFELYDGGHLITAGTAWHLLRGDDRLLEVARRFADHVREVIESSHEPIVPRHPGIESALVGLSRATAETAYLDLAETLLRRRGVSRPAQHVFSPEFYVEDAPVAAGSTIRGHAVMALYLLKGAVDIAVARDDAELLAAVEAQWHDMVSTKVYVTGGVGARHYEEGFGDPYELPLDRSYQETCAAVASVELSQRLLEATGDARYADLVERTLYNAVLPGISLDGTRYFYDNPLHVRDVAGLANGAGRSGRQPWFECACCPPNVMRALASVEEYVAGTTPRGLQIDQIVPSRIDLATPSGSSARVELTTDLPLGDGSAVIDVLDADGSSWELALRIPEWARGATAQLLLEDVAREELRCGGRYLRVTRRWRPGDRVAVSLPPEVRRIVAHPMVTACRGLAAVQRGPLVYCLESVDQPEGTNLELVSLDPGSAVEVSTCVIGDERLPMLELSGTSHDASAWGDSLYSDLESAPRGTGSATFQARMIPYFAWANRGQAAMRVWVPAQSTELGGQ